MDIKRNFKTELVTERLLLSPWQLEFSEKMYENWATDVEVTKYLFWDPHKNIDETRQIISSWIDNKNYDWCIRVKETGEPIGSINVVKNYETDFRCEIGYCLSRKYWKNGYMTEALKSVINFLFEEGYNKIELRHAVENVASGRVMQKAGMTFLVTSPKDTFVKGRFFDCNYYYILNPNNKFC